MDSLDAAVYVTDMETHELLFANERIRALFGDVVGRVCWKTLHDGQTGPCDFCTNAQLVDADGKSTGVLVWQIDNPKAGGWWELRDRAIEWVDGRLVRLEIATDINLRKRAEEALRVRERYLSALSAAAKVLLPSRAAVPFQEVLDALGEASRASRVYAFVNHRSAEGALLTSQVAEWCAEGVEPQAGNPELYDHPLSESFPRWVEALSRGEPISGQVASFPPSERAVLEPQGILALLVFPLLVRGAFAGFVGFDNCASAAPWQDAERAFLAVAASNLAQAMERQRAEVERLALERQALEAQRAQSLTVLAGGVAHDFNNLLTAIVGSAELALMDAEGDGPVALNLQRIRVATERAAELVRHLSAYAGQGPCSFEPVSLTLLVQKLSSQLLAAVNGAAELRLELGSRAELARGDPEQLRQVALILVANAAEAMRGREGWIAVRTGAVDCGQEALAQLTNGAGLAAGRYAYLEVEDEGEGVAPEARARLFEPFFSTRFTGRGLGLAAVLGVVRRHEGAIEVRSQLGGGSLFRVLIPTAAAREPAVAVKRFALVVDDEPDVRAILGLMLRRLGFEVVSACDGREGADAFAAAPDRYQLVLLDQVMPRLDGRECLLEIRELRAEVPVVIISGCSPETTRAEFSGDEALTFLDKPFTFSSLTQATRRALGEAR